MSDGSEPPYIPDATEAQRGRSGRSEDSYRSGSEASYRSGSFHTGSSEYSYYSDEGGSQFSDDGEGRGDSRRANGRGSCDSEQSVDFFASGGSRAGRKSRPSGGRGGPSGPSGGTQGIQSQGQRIALADFFSDDESDLGEGQSGSLQDPHSSVLTVG
eukprot:gene438-98_t